MNTQAARSQEQRGTEILDGKQDFSEETRPTLMGQLGQLLEEVHDRSLQQRGVILVERASIRDDISNTR